MSRLIFLCSFALCIPFFGQGQMVDKYGISFGATYSNQIWNYKIIDWASSGATYKAGVACFIFAEKGLSKKISIRSGLGYMEKGFKSTLQLTDHYGEFIKLEKENVVAYNMALDLSGKFAPFDRKFSPYLLVGVRGEYVFSYRDVRFTEPVSGKVFGIYKGYLEDFNRVIIGGVIIVGCEINDLFFIEAEFNPAITNTFNDLSLNVRDVCWGLKAGLNINELMN